MGLLTVWLGISDKNSKYAMWKFKAEIEIIGSNPFVFVPGHILMEVFKQAGKNKGHIPICGTINGKPYLQTLVRYSGEWRLYINTNMLKDSPRRIGEIIDVSIAFDNADRTIQPHPKLVAALHENPEAKAKFEALSPSTQKELVRYISFLKTEKSIDKNIQLAISFLMGKARFIGREALK